MLSTNTMEIENSMNTWLNENDPILFKNKVEDQANVAESIKASSPE